MRKITIDPVTRIEGHAKIDIYLDDTGSVADTHFHVTQVRGFEKFTEGRPFYEMPSITARICGICPVSHLLASAKACDAIMAVRRRRPAVKLRELIHCAQFVQSHALSFFHLSAPDLLLGFDSDPARRNVFGLIEQHPETGARRESRCANSASRSSKAWRRSACILPGSCPAASMRRSTSPARDRILAGLPNARALAKRTLAHFKSVLDRFAEEIAALRLRRHSVRRAGGPGRRARLV